MKIKLNALRWAMAIAVLVIFGLSALGYWSLRADLRSLSSTKRLGAIWAANQLEFELLRFSNTLALFIAADPDASAEEVQFRFDILWSRQAVTARDIEDHVDWKSETEAAAVGDFGRLLREVEDRIVNLAPGDTATAKTLYETFLGFSKPLHDYTIMVKEKQADIDLLARENILSLSKVTAAFGATLAIASILLAVLFYFDSRTHRRISAENRRLFEQSQAAYRAKVEFLSTVSHELRTPLTSIKGVLGLFCGGIFGQLSDKAQQMSQIAYKNSCKLESLINDIMDSAKSDSSEWTLDLQEFDLVERAMAAAKSNESYRPNRTITVVNDADGEILVQADPFRIDQVMSNLLSNALKFSDEGTDVLLTVDRTETEALIKVQDFGAGIPEHFHDRLFDAFTQADSSDTRSAEGTGLGMSIAKKIVESHGGTIHFESKEGAGTTFTITLPLTQTQQARPIDNLAA